MKQLVKSFLEVQTLLSPELPEATIEKCSLIDEDLTVKLIIFCPTLDVQLEKCKHCRFNEASYRRSKSISPKFTNLLSSTKVSTRGCLHVTEETTDILSPSFITGIVDRPKMTKIEINLDVS